VIHANRLKSLEQTLATGAYLFREGDYTSEMYILLEGRVDVIKGETLIASVSEPGTYLGELAVLLGVPRSATLRAATHCRFYVVPRAQVPKFFESATDLGFKLAKVLATRLLSMNERHREVLLRNQELEEKLLPKSEHISREMNSESVASPSAIKKLLQLTSSEAHRAVLHHYARHVGTLNAVAELVEACHVDRKELQAVLKDFGRLKLVHLLEDEQIVFLQCGDSGLSIAIQGWAGDQDEWL